jgi:hypothetical protein
MSQENTGYDHGSEGQRLSGSQQAASLRLRNTNEAETDVHVDLEQGGELKTSSSFRGRWTWNTQVRLVLALMVTAAIVVTYTRSTPFSQEQYVKHLRVAGQCLVNASANKPDGAAPLYSRSERVEICKLAKAPMQEKLHVFAMISGQGKVAEHIAGTCSLFESAVRQAMPLTVIGWDSPTINKYFDKVTNSRRYLERVQQKQHTACAVAKKDKHWAAHHVKATCCTEQIVVFSDAFDSIYNIPEDKLLQSIKDVLAGGADMVFGAEANYFGFPPSNAPYVIWHGGKEHQIIKPSEGIQWGAESAAGYSSPYTYLNSGVFAGWLDAALQTITAVDCMASVPDLHEDVYWSDQHSYQLVYQASAFLNIGEVANGLSATQIKHAIASMGLSPAAADRVPKVALTDGPLLAVHEGNGIPALGGISFKGLVMWNDITKEQPGIIHFNGGSKQKLKDTVQFLHDQVPVSAKEVESFVKFVDLNSLEAAPFPVSIHSMCQWR